MAIKGKSFFSSFDPLLAILLYGVFVSNMNNSQISSFFPQYSEEKFNINETIIGVIFASYSIGVFGTSLAIGAHMNHKGVKKIMLILGLFVMTATNISFMFLEYIENKDLFIVIAVLLRTIMGGGQALFMTPAYSIVPLLYRETLEDKIGYMEAMAGFGLGIGPLFGGFLF
jgi:MFS family permease